MNTDLHNDNINLDKNKSYLLLKDTLECIFSKGAADFILKKMVKFNDNEITIFTSIFLHYTPLKKIFFDVEKISKGSYCIVKIKDKYVDLLKKYVNSVFKTTKVNIL